MLTHMELFAGAGGMALGFQSQPGQYRTQLLVDNDRTAATTWRRNRPKVPYSIRDLSRARGRELLELSGLRAGELDVLTAGPPCQGFSRAGQRLADDPRNALLFHTVDLVAEMRPRVVVIENVPQLAYEDGLHVDELELALDRAGYESHVEIVDAWRYGVPQLRRRAFVFATLKREGLVPERLVPTSSSSETFTAQTLIRAAQAGEPLCPPGLSVEDAIGDLPSLEPGAGTEAARYDAPVSTAYQCARRRNARVLFNHASRKHTPAFVERLKQIPEGGRNLDLPHEQRFGGSNDYFSQAYGRLHRGGIAQTITTFFQNPGSGRFIHYSDHRGLTVREAARFQSFDDTFFFTGTASEQMRQVGNAVPVLLAQAVAAAIAQVLVAGRPVGPPALVGLQQGL